MSQKAKLRVISGSFKGLKISFAPSEYLRPTPQRTKETLFNWLQLSIKHAQCLDLFAGTGNLGFEALSRGAKEVVFIEKDKQLLKSINNLINQLQLESSSKTLAQDGLIFLRNCKQRFDIIFLDAPFQTSLNMEALALIDEHHLLKDKGLVYYEHDRTLSDEDIFPFHISKKQKTGQVYSYLLELKQ
ncbi:MAG: 16S rRNA (guanine(966)-N(2))-methyltransferase RsmD [Gammaproteobacteria bacterium]